MLPLDVARGLFNNHIRGDEETFFKWILPQLYLVRCDWRVNNFPVKQWVVSVLRGVEGEWQGEVDPWRGCVG